MSYESGQDKPAEVVRNLHDRINYENTTTAGKSTTTIDALLSTEAATRDAGGSLLNKGGQAPVPSSNTCNDDNSDNYTSSSDSTSYNYNDASMSTAASIDISQMSGVQDSSYF